MIKWRSILSHVATGVRLEEKSPIPTSTSFGFMTVAQRSLNTRPIKQLQQHRKPLKRPTVSHEESLVQQSIASRRLDQAKKKLAAVTTKIDRLQTWRPLILLARKGRHRQDLVWLQQMIERKEMTRLYGLVPDMFDYHALMYCYGIHRDLASAERVFFNLPQSPTVFSTNTLLGCYQRASVIEPAVSLLHKKSTPVDVGSYNTVLAMLDVSEQWEEAKSLYQRMPMQPDRYTFSTMLHIATQTKDHDLGRPIYDKLFKMLHHSPNNTNKRGKTGLDITSINTMLAFLVTVMHDVDQALEIYTTLLSKSKEWTPDTITCNILLDGLLKYHRNPGKAAAMVYQMTKQGYLIPDDTTFGIMMDAEIALGGDMKGVLTLFNQASPSDRIMSILANAAAKLDYHDDPTTLEHLWDTLGSAKLDIKAYNGLMHGLAKHGRADFCQSLYDRVFRSHSICVADVATFTSLILAYINSGQVNDAMEIYHVLHEQHYKQHEERHQPPVEPKRPWIELDVIFYTTLISALTASSPHTLSVALELFKDMRQLRIQPSIQTYTTMLHWCGRANDRDGLDQIHQLIKLDMSLDPDIGIYNALMDGYNRTQQIDQVLYLWDTMLTSGFDSTTISIVLDACGHHGQLHRGRAIWSFLQKQSRSPLNTNNWNSYVEFLCRVGHRTTALRWEQAYEVVHRMVMEASLPSPNEKTWNTLASFARKYGLDRDAAVVQKLDTLKLDVKRF